MVETLTRERGNSLPVPDPAQRYQLANHLGSATLELDEAARVISYEEYAPFGATAYQAGRDATEVRRKRYRYTGKERDEENGFTYHGSRYCAPWLGRWTSCDPAGLVDGSNRYGYAKNNPIALQDRTGFDTVLNLLAEDARAQREQDLKERFDQQSDEASQGPPDTPVKEDSIPGGVKEDPEGGKKVEYKEDLNRVEVQDQAVSGFEAGVANSTIEFVQGAVKTSLDQIPGAAAKPLEHEVDAYFDAFKVRPTNSDASAAGYFAGVWFFNTVSIIITHGALRSLGGGGGGPKVAASTEAEVEETASGPLGTSGGEGGGGGAGGAGSGPPGGSGGPRNPAQIKSETFGVGKETKGTGTPLERTEQRLKEIQEGTYKPPPDLTKEHLTKYRDTIRGELEKGRNIDKSGLQKVRLKIIDELLKRFFP